MTEGKQMNNEVQFYKFHRNGKSLPKNQEWIMEVGIDDDGTVYAPSACCPGGEKVALFWASFDGVPIVLHFEHIYCPTDWLRSQINEELLGASGTQREELKQTLESIGHMEQEVRNAAGVESSA